ncbi:M16 family metallopeptidase [Thermosulfuriphilus sp.]
MALVRKLWPILILFLFMEGLGGAVEIGPGLQKTVLENGLTVIVKESHRAPVVAIQVWVKAGSLYERDQEAGVSHFIEHLIFRGGEERPSGALAEEIESAGGSINAYTSYDYTVYHLTVPQQAFKEALGALAEALFHPVFDKQDIDREREVILEEMRMRQDQPEIKLSRVLMQLAYPNHPYGRPIIGYESTLKALGRQEIISYYERRYRPVHMTLVIVGDVSAEEALSQAMAYFGKAPYKKPIAFSVPQREAPPQGLKILNEDIQEGYLQLAFPGPSLTTLQKAAVADVLAVILGSGRSSRLYQKIREKQGLVSGIGAYSFTPLGPGLFRISARLEPDNLEAALKAILTEVYRLKYSPPLPEELARAKTKVESDFIYIKELMEGEARRLGVFQTILGDPQAEATYLKAVRSVTAEMIQELAGQCFRSKNLAAAVALPQDATFLNFERFSSISEEAELAAQGISPSERGFVAPTYRRILSNGLTVLVREVPDVPTFAVRVVFPGGLRFETEETNGIFRLLSASWIKGTSKHSSRQLAEIIESMGGSLSGFSGRNTVGLEGEFLSRNIKEALNIFTEILTQATFPEEEVERAKGPVIAAIRASEDNPSELAMKEFNRLLFEGHPYGLSPLGRQEVVAKLTGETLRQTYRRFIRPSRGVLAIVGDVEAREVFEILESLLGGWQQGQEEAPEPPGPPLPLSAPKFSTLHKEIGQAHLLLGFRTPGLESPDRFALDILAATLSGQSGRLFRNLRDKEALAYSVTAFYRPLLGTGSFAFYIASAPEKKDRALKGLWQAIYKLNTEGLSKEEVERAQKRLIGRYEIGLQTNGAQALDMALNELYGLGYNFALKYIRRIQEVSLEQVMETARKYLGGDLYVLVSVEPLSSEE